MSTIIIHILGLRMNSKEDECMDLLSLVLFIDSQSTSWRLVELDSRC